MTQGLLRRELKRFAFEVLCVLLLLHGSPLLAMQGGSAPAGAPPAPPGFSGKAREAEDAEPAASGAKSSSLEAIPLIPGWNLVSLPEEPADPDPMAVLAAISGAYIEVSAHDACDPADPWKTFDPNDPAASDLTALDHRTGFWIEATSAVALPSDGTLPATTSFELCTGWNLIGMPIGQPRHVRSVLHPIEGKYVRVFGYDASTPEQLWEGFDVQAPYWANNLDYLLPGRGYWVLVTEDVTLEIANQGPEPAVAISSPQDLDVVTQPTEVVGTVASGLLESWALSYRLIGEPEWVEIESREYPVADGELGTFDPTLLKNGLYELRLEATDLQGRVVEETIAVTVEGQMKVGHFTLSFVDLAVPLSGLDIEVVRTYDSRDRRQGDFGFGWTLDLRQGSYSNNRPPGDGWRIETGFLPCDTMVETKSHLTVVRLSDQEVYRFALRLADGEVTGGGCFATARFDFVDGPLPGTTLEIVGNDSVFFANGSNEVVDADTLEPYEPEDVRLTTRDGRIFELDLIEGVTRLADLNGNQLTITPAGITHSAGKAIIFERDAEGRIERIVDPRGNDLLYGYDEAGDLHTVTNQAGHVTRFEYDDDHRMADIFDPRGVRAVRTEYDADGRLTSVTDALGHPIELRHELEANQEIVTNRLGLVKVLTYDSRGNVIEELDEAGKRTVRSYDAKDRLLTETDPNENTTTYVYDPDGNLLSVEDPLGNKTQFGDYDALGNPWTITDPRGKVTRNTYDGSGNLLTTKDPLDHVTTFTYDSRGQLETETDADQKVTRYEYDDFGNQTKIIDALGHETTSTYDASGNLLTQSTARTLPDGTTETLTTTFTVDELGRTVETVLPDGSSTGTTYDFLGAVIATRDALGRVTTYEHDDAGRQTKTIYPDTTFEDRTYDLEGRLLTLRNRAAKVTAFEYDQVGRLTKTIDPGSAVTESRYDAGGRLVTSIDARGQTTTLGYDAAGRQTTVTDSLGSVTTFRYDAAGNQVEREDPLERITRFDYDDAGRLVRTHLPDGETTATEYDALGRRVAEVDQALVRTEFSYDALGRLVQVKDALGGITTYGYDELGNRISQTDAKQHTTRLDYDAVGRQAKRILPDGAFEIFTYDAAGNRQTRTDFNGVTTAYEYDVNGRLSRRSYPDGSAVSITYTPTGRRSTVTDPRGVTSYYYDDRDRLVRQVVPEGYELAYTWDAAGNQTSISALLADGTTLGTTYTYDELGRMKTVTDSRGGVYTYSYDAAGQRTSLSHPNGVVTTYLYDTLGRPLKLRTESSSAAVIQSYAYQLGPTGNRLAVTEWDGTVRSYQYDLLYRLTSERVEDGSGTLVYQNTFGYDPVGNRLTQDRMAANGTVEPVVYSYDDRDRLLAESSVSGGSGRDFIYEWDANGNQISKMGTGPDGEVVDTGHRWDLENRLIEVSLADGSSITNTYDADGVWTGERVVGGNAPGETGWVVDAAGRSSVLGEFQAELTNEIVRGERQMGVTELLAAFSSTASLGLHLDGIGSVRATSDVDGAIHSVHQYETFGTPLTTTSDDEPPAGFSFTGNQLANELVYLRARWLSPHIGRFVSMDAHEGFYGYPRTLHRFNYALNNPITVTDHSGRFPDWLERLLVGTQVHTQIGIDFVRHDPRTRLSNKAISTVLALGSKRCLTGDQNLYKHCRVRPDLVDLHSREVYEIKTVRGAARGETELLAYLAMMNSSDPQGRRWIAGSTYQPPSALVVVVPPNQTHAVEVYPPVGGVITYSATNLKKQINRSVEILASAAVLTAMLSLMITVGLRSPTII